MAKTIPASQFHTNILQWYSRSSRNLPWRTTRHPYRILLSEIMSQQTQVRRAADHYRRWIRTFPTFSSLADASAADVLREWSGLGYNSRALRLHQLAKIIAREFRSRLPEDPVELQKLPGIGRYTASAVACFAFGKNIAVVDVNIRRVLTRWTKKVSAASEQYDEERAWKLAEKFLPKKDAGVWNQSLMDLGGAICTARNPKCLECPVASLCSSAFSRAFLVTEQRRKKSEPAWKGIPRRLYRGKILKLLHYHSCSAQEVAALLWNTHTRRDVVWTAAVLERMRSDGLLSFRHDRYSIAQ